MGSLEVYDMRGRLIYRHTSTTPHILDEYSTDLINHLRNLVRRLGTSCTVVPRGGPGAGLAWANTIIIFMNLGFFVSLREFNISDSHVTWLLDLLDAFGIRGDGSNIDLILPATASISNKLMAKRLGFTVIQWSPRL